MEFCPLIALLLIIGTAIITAWRCNHNYKERERDHLQGILKWLLLYIATSPESQLKRVRRIGRIYMNRHYDKDAYGFDCKDHEEICGMTGYDGDMPPYEKWRKQEERDQRTRWKRDIAYYGWDIDEQFDPEYWY